MKPSLIKYSFLIELIVLIACTPQAAPSAAVPEALASPGLKPVDLAGPKMSVGSTWLYADGTLLVAVPGGMFTRGGNLSDAPVQQVNIGDFWMYRTKVTNAQFAYCVDMGGCTKPARHDNPSFRDAAFASAPVVGVDYGQAAAYCTFVHARLPTEAEWEKAARGLDGQTYPWGNGAPDCSLLNYDGCVGNTTPVNHYPGGQSYYTAFDMEGNALEWASDWYDKEYYNSAPLADPQGPSRGHFRVVRSSAFNSGGDQTQAYNRFFSGPHDHRDNLSFRCIVLDPTYYSPYCDYPATYGTDGVGGPTAGKQPVVNCPPFGITQDTQCNGPGSPITYVTFNGPPLLNAQIFGGGCSIVNSSPLKYGCTQSGTIQACSYCTTDVRTAPQCPEGYDFNLTTKKCDPHHLAPPAGAANCMPGFVAQQQDQSGTGLPAGSNSQCCAQGGAVVATPNPTAQSPIPAYCLPDQNSYVMNCTCPAGYTLNGTFCSPPDPNASIGGGWHCAVGYYEQDPNTYEWIYHCLVQEFDQCPAGTNFDGQECISTTYQSVCKSQGIALSSCTSGGGGDDLGCQPPSGGCGMNYAWNPQTCTCDCNGC